MCRAVLRRQQARDESGELWFGFFEPGASLPGERFFNRLRFRNKTLTHHRLNSFDSLVERRVRRSQPDAVVLDAVAEKDVTGFLCAWRMNDGLFRRRLHLFQSVRQSFGITGELDGGGVGEKFALPRNGPFNHTTEKRSVPTDEGEKETDCQDHQVHKQTNAGADFRRPSDITVT